MSLHTKQNVERMRASTLSLVAGVLILAAKYAAYRITDSAALKSDAIEGIVNVAASLFAMGAVLFAGKPADADHPYGHGKIEHFSAAFEGGLVSFAAFFIIYEAVKSYLEGGRPENLGLGLMINLSAGALSGLLGLYLISKGRKTKSHAIEADGHHVLSDFFTTLALGVGLAVYALTGLPWLDPLLALLVGLWLGFTGFKLVKASAEALLDQESPETLELIAETLEREKNLEVIAVHGLRTLRIGSFTHIDLHFVVPEFHSVRESHDRISALSKTVLERAGIEGEVHAHLDPCGRNFCVRCELSPCSIRREPFQKRVRITREQAIQPEPPES